MSHDNTGIAIIGMGLRFPGADTPAEFWSNLVDGVESITHFTVEELIASGVAPEVAADPNYVPSRFVLPHAGEFDAAFFDVRPQEAEITDPQFRVFLQCAWEAIEHAGYDLHRYRGSVGVYAGSSWSSYLPSVVAARGGNRDVYLHNDKDFLATWTSYKLDLRGPSLGVQSYCSTSLAAVHIACQGLWNYECDMALAGGVTISVPLRSGYYRAAGDIVSADGHCRPYSASATGLVFGDGAGVVLLKRLDEAVRDGDFIHAVIRGSAINNDGGKRPGYTAPSVEGQEAVITQAVSSAGVHPRSISYVEGHGTGTLLGDATEVRALHGVFSRASRDRGYCGLGSVKANVGHLDRAAGVSSLIKTVLALEHAAIPPTLLFDEPNPEIDFCESAFYVPREAAPWIARNGEPRRAGVTSLGIGGTNVHVILEQAPARAGTQRVDGVHTLLLSAPTVAGLQRMRTRLAEHLRTHRQVGLADVAHTLQAGRRVFERRHVLRARDVDDAIAQLESNGPSDLSFDWSSMGADSPGLRTPLPTYPFERTVHWIDSRFAIAPAPAPQKYIVPSEPSYESEEESRIARIWADVLEQSLPGRTERFLDVGGHSLAAVRVASRIQQEFGVPFDMSELFEAPTVAALAARLRLSDAGATVPETSHAPTTLSFGQERIWFLSQVEDDPAVFHIALGLEVKGKLDVVALQQAFERVIERHEPLRTVYENDAGRPLPSCIVGAAFHIESAEAHRDGLDEALVEESRRPFHLETGPVLRARLFRFSREHCFMLVTVHHIACDGWSVSLLGNEICHFYTSLVSGVGSRLPPLAQRYSDFAAAQREAVASDRGQESLAYWKRKLDGARPLLAAVPAMAEKGAGTLFFRMDVEEARAVQRLASENGATLFMALLAALQTVLQRYTGESDLIIGAPVAGRQSSEWESLIGFFLNTLPLRTDAGGNPTFRELLKRCRKTCLEAYRHQTVPFEMLVNELRPERHAAETPLFQVLLVLQTYPMDPVVVPGLRIAAREVHTGSVHAPLTVQISPLPDGLHGMVEFDRQFLSARVAEALTAFFRNVLRQGVADPDRPLSTFRWMTDAPSIEPAAVLSTFEPVQSRILRTAREHPQRTAIRCGALSCSYADLCCEAERLHAALHAAGVRPGDIVGLHAARSPKWIAGMLAILRAGASYLPLDPAQPMERRARMCADARASVVLGGPIADGATCIPLVWTASAVSGPAPHDSASNELAYVIYTSGSTGEPKGVAVTHGSLSQLTSALIEKLGTTPKDRYLQFASLTWDTSVEEIFPCLCSGATLVLRDDDMLDPAELCRKVDAHGITFLDLPTDFWHTLTTHLTSTEMRLPECVHTLIIGGAPARADVLRQWWRTTGASTRLINSYGASELTAISLLCDVLADTSDMPLGRPLAGCSAYVLDRALHAVPDGVTGELYVGGSGVSGGYLHHFALTAERFLPDPYSAVGGARMYRTGDLVVRREDGFFEIIGRIDRQIKIRGHRVEPGEIERALRGVEGLDDAAVIAVGTGDQRYLAACYASSQSIDERDLLRGLQSTLPEFLIPAVLLRVDSLPETASGKIDYTAVADLIAKRAARTTRKDRRELQHPHEEILAGLWAEVLGHSAPSSAEDNFFALGGHSLLATQLVARIRRTFRVDLPLRSIFEHPVLRDMAEQVWMRLASDAIPQDPPRPADFDGLNAVSFAQQRLWFLQSMFPKMSAYNMPVMLHHVGPLDSERLARCFDVVVARHQTLHCVFRDADGQPAMELVEPTPVEIPVLDLRGMERVACLTQAWRAAHEQVAQPFELSQWPLFRILIVRLGDEEYGTIFTIHHILADAWSMRILSREIATLYEALSGGLAAMLAPLPIRFSDFAQWQRCRLTPAARQELLGFWKRTLDGVPLLRLPYDFSHPAMADFRGAAYQWEIPDALAARVYELARKQSTTLFVVLLSAFCVLLEQYSGQTDFSVGFPVTGRGQPEVEELIGFFVNTLLLRANLAGEPTFEEILQRTRTRVLEALAHQDLPFEELIEHVHRRRSMGHNPSFQTCFAVNTALPGNPVLEGQTISPVAIDTGTTKFELSMSFAALPGALIGFLEYDSNLFAPSTIQEMARGMESLLEELCTDPGRKIASRKDRYSLLESSRPDWLGRNIRDLIADQVRANPQAPAIEFRGEALSYEELDRRARRVSGGLRALGAAPEAVIGLRGERGLEMMIALVGILQAGCAWMPIDPAAPTERTRALLRDASVEIVLPDAHVETDADFDETLDVFPETLCYLIYTSGSTGVPKGVMTEHHAITNRLLWARSAFDVKPGDRILQKTSLTFDVSVWELLLPLISGATVVFAEPGRHTDMRYLAETIASERITMVHFVPSVLQEFLQERDLSGIQHLRCTIASGEALAASTADRFFERLPGELFNLYGPTEAAVDVTAFRCKPGSAIPIGWPISNVRVTVEDGEICISGVASARGYLGKPSLTASAFLPDPKGNGSRVYHTGDRGRIRSDGAIEYLGRLDAQVKLRGVRIEPAEIEEALRQHPAVFEAAVVVRTQDFGDILEAFIVPRAGGAPHPNRLRQHLRNHLPEAMIPARIHAIRSMPITAHGKLDRSTLLRMDVDLSREHVAPRSEAELELATLWNELLPFEHLGVHDNFFELGGHSLLLARLASRIRAVFGVDVGLAELFDGPTIYEMTTAIAMAQLAGMDEDACEALLSNLDLQESGDSSSLSAGGSL